MDVLALLKIDYVQPAVWNSIVSKSTKTFCHRKILLVAPPMEALAAVCVSPANPYPSTCRQSLCRLPSSIQPTTQDDGTTSMEKKLESVVHGSTPITAFPKKPETEEQRVSVGGGEEGPEVTTGSSIDAVPETEAELSVCAAEVVATAAAESDEADGKGVPHVEPSGVPTTAESDEDVAADTDGEMSAAVAVAVPVAVGSVAALVAGGLEDSSSSPGLDEEASTPCADDEAARAVSVRASEAAVPLTNETVSLGAPGALESASALETPVPDAPSTVVEKVPEVEMTGEAAPTVEAGMKDTVGVSVIDVTFGMIVWPCLSVNGVDVVHLLQDLLEEDAGISVGCCSAAFWYVQR